MSDPKRTSRHDRARALLNHVAEAGASEEGDAALRSLLEYIREMEAVEDELTVAYMAGQGAGRAGLEAENARLKQFIGELPGKLQEAELRAQLGPGEDTPLAKVELTHMWDSGECAEWIQEQAEALLGGGEKPEDRHD
ncbi:MULTISPECIES: hypothetical protein [unclassified Thioalkalivibrio]|uniref:hypothetical protein n=1 Tax=unclassified Thioalkalivibrio TaxID=2621013 RepID=UPI0003663A34|nr:MULTISPECIES: hypothetical protein [unclassified Thioalkalivibrio]